MASEPEEGTPAWDAMVDALYERRWREVQDAHREAIDADRKRGIITAYVLPEIVALLGELGSQDFCMAWSLGGDDGRKWARKQFMLARERYRPRIP